jgi:hypothetical protein
MGAAAGICESNDPLVIPAAGQPPSNVTVPLIESQAGTDGGDQ